MALDPKGKYLIQDGSGTIYIWTEALSNRKDMRPYDHETKGKFLEPTAAEKRVPIELQGKTFMVEAPLHAVLTDMGKVLIGMQEENRALKDAAEKFAAFKERLETDNLDLQEQLEKSRAQIDQIDQLTKPVEHSYAPTEKKGKK